MKRFEKKLVTPPPWESAELVEVRCFIHFNKVVELVSVVPVPASFGVQHCAAGIGVLQRRFLNHALMHLRKRIFPLVPLQCRAAAPIDLRAMVSSYRLLRLFFRQPLRPVFLRPKRHFFLAMRDSP